MLALSTTGSRTSTSLTAWPTPLRDQAMAMTRTVPAKAGVPVVPGTSEPLRDVDEARTLAATARVPALAGVCADAGMLPVRDGVGSFHAMFSVVVHFTGSPVSRLVPFS